LAEIVAESPESLELPVPLVELSIGLAVFAASACPAVIA
jgi:hypothetical protein